MCSHLFTFQSVAVMMHCVYIMLFCSLDALCLCHKSVKLYVYNTGN